MEMTKAQLMQLLQPLNDNDIIVLSNDQEGNSYRKLECVDVARYYADYGNVGLRELTDADREAGYTEDDLMQHPDAVDAIVLY